MRWMEMLREGGEWLAAARNWLKWNTRNGDQVKWGSAVALEPSLTVRQVEELAAVVAAVAERNGAEDGALALRQFVVSCASRLCWSPDVCTPEQPDCTPCSARRELKRRGWL